MVTVSHIVQKTIQKKIFLQEVIAKGIASYGSIAKQIKPEIEEEIGKEVEHNAIVAAIRRYAEKIDIKYKDIKFDAENTEVNLKTNIVDITVLKSISLFDKLKKIYDIIDFEKGDILNLVYGRNQVSIITNERYKKQITSYLKNEKIIEKKEDLVAISIIISKELMRTPGVLFHIIRDFAWENINIIETISSDVEMTFIVDHTDAVAGYKALQNLVT